MLKYFLSIILAIAMMACSSDQENESQADTQQNPPTQQQFQPNQNPVDIDVSDEELETFAEISMVAQQIQMGSQQEMLAAVEEEELDVQTYNTIAESRFNDQSDSDLDVSDEDIEKFEAASQKIEGMQADVESDMMDAVEAEGMEMNRFMEINAAIQQDQELQQRIQQMMMEKMQQQGQGQPQDQ